VALETGAFIYLLEKIEKGSHVLIASESLIYENNKSPDEQRKVRVASYFNLAREFVGADFSDEERVNVLKKLGFPDIDALHIALAEKSRADYFVTCDDDIIKLYKRHRDLVKVNIVSLIELVGLEVR
jgi:predicted nucleic acid-binding protein